MEEATKRRWLDLCSEAAICDDPERIRELLEAITTLLRQEERRLENSQFRGTRTAP